MAKRRFEAETIAALVERVQKGEQSLSSIAREQGLHPGVLSKWVKREREKHAPSAPALPIEELSQRLAQLEDRVETLRSVLEKIYVHKYS